MESKNIKFEVLNLKDVIPSANNPRQRVNVNTQSFKDLLESIKAGGIKVPLMVRPHPEQKDKYELLAGSRRLVAASDAKIETAGCNIHFDISDEDAFDITFFENFGREDLSPLEEGRAAAIMLRKYKGDIAAAASKLGKSIKWVSQRVAIETKFCKKAKDVLAKNSSFADWTASHIQQIVGLPDDLQLEVLSQYEYRETPTVQDVEQYVAKLMRSLSKVPWQMEELVEISINGKKKTVRCDKCLKRTSRQPGLFDNTLDDEQLKKNDRCLDSECFHCRSKAYLLCKIGELRKEHSKLVCISGLDEYSSGAYELRKSFGQVFFNREYKEVSKNNDKAIPALSTDDGQIKYIIPVSKSGGSLKKAKGEDGQLVKRPMKERTKELEGKRWFSVLRQMRVAIDKTTIKNVKLQKDKDEVFMALKLAVFIGTYENAVKKNNGTSGCYGGREVMAKFTKSLTGQNVDKLAAMLFEAVKPNLVSEVTYGGAITQTPDDNIKSAKAIAELLGINIAEMYKKAVVEYPVPKSWTMEKTNANKKAKK
jgi:ParB/RepB/Spo0J family partition protein